MSSFLKFHIRVTSLDVKQFVVGLRNHLLAYLAVTQAFLFSNYFPSLASLFIYCEAIYKKAKFKYRSYWQTFIIYAMPLNNNLILFYILSDFICFYKSSRGEAYPYWISCETKGRGGTAQRPPCFKKGPLSTSRIAI